VTREEYERALGYRPGTLTDEQFAKLQAASSAPTRREEAYSTKLTHDEDLQFNRWVQASGVPYDASNDSDYDMRGYWKAQQHGDPRATRDTESMHFPDTWKTPRHKTFSNESIYAGPGAPRWVGNKLVAADGTVIAEE
jgi:hypothetical protein